MAGIMSASPAYADWQFTRWGMTAEQVAAASGGTVTVGPGDPKEEYAGAKIGALGTYVSGEYKFRAVFYFTDRKLVDVRLRMLSEQPHDDGYKLKNSLDGIYGKTFSQSTGLLSIFTYHDDSKNNRIDLVMIANTMTTLEYRPLRDSSAAGL